MDNGELFETKRKKAVNSKESEYKSEGLRFSGVIFSGVVIIVYLLLVVIISNLFEESFDKKSWSMVTLIYSSVSILFCLCFFQVYKSRQKKYKVIVQDELEEYRSHIQNVQLQKMQEQLNALQSQINPHFLYNTLDTIRGFALEKNAAEIADLVAALSSMFKYSMDYASPLVTVNDEISYLSRYLKIQSMRFPGKLTFEQIYECNSEVLCSVMIPKLSLQPIVENAISHGFSEISSGGRIVIRYIETDTALKIIISDNGKGMSEDLVLNLNRMFYKRHTQVKTTRHGGIALPNIDLRIKLYCGDQYGLFIASTPGLGTDVTMTVPIDLNTANFSDYEAEL